MAEQSQIGPYRVQRKLHEGGQGSVVLAYDQRLLRQVAIKTYRIPDDRQRRRELLAEARRLAGIDHPHVVKVYDVVEARNHMAMVMEYIPGCDLEALLGRRRLSIDNALAVAVDLARGLTAALRNRLVHGDLKPANVLIDRNGRARLIDFGISLRANALPESRQSALQRCGSCSALTPEHLLGQPLDHRSDLYAMGLVYYRLFTGLPPFFRDGRLSGKDLLQGRCLPIEQAGTGTEHLPDGLSDLVGDLLRVDPMQRPGNTVEVRHRLMQVRHELPLYAGSPLAATAAVVFRSESEQDLPPQVPGDLRRHGKSRLRPSHLNELWSWHSIGWREKVLPLALGLLLVATPAVTLWAWYQSQPRQNLFVARPVFEMDGAAGMPDHLSLDWLHQTVQ